MNLDERLEALTMNLEPAARGIEALRAAGAEQSQRIAALEVLARQDGENIRALARIAEIHERRLSTLEGDQEK
ncbi:MAG TPA: hypothetical protein VE959_35020 [Bryobacteraceae bacterium]|nr:hypothetical protein [Bryobacteraceae bacterium]